MHAAIGFRVKSGSAVAVLLAGPVESPQVLDRRIVELCDPAVPESRQPYHAGMGTLETDDAKLARRCEFVRRAAGRSVPELIHEYRGCGHDLHGAGLVTGSDTDPARITNTHIRAHALEGQLFRTALEDAIRSCELSCAVFIERKVYTRATEILGQSEVELKRAMTRMSRPPGGPWRADEKAAALAAWLVLASRGEAG
ncbi:MAG TPA: hypothetical protein VKE40_00420 [Gemmataceae bacterium]|nr:hypothetical protein [Gemmataceae bacterium]